MFYRFSNAVENPDKMSLENLFQNNIFDKEKLFKTIFNMSNTKIENRLKKLAKIILNKNNEVVSLIKTSAYLESKFKRVLKQNEVEEVNKSELITIEKKLNKIIRKYLHRK